MCNHGLSGWDCGACGPSDAAIRKRYGKTEEYYRRAADLIDDFFGPWLVEQMTPEVRAAFESMRDFASKPRRTATPKERKRT